MKKVIKALLKRYGYLISCGAASEVDFLKSRNASLVLDVGANLGQYAKSLRADGYQGRIVSFEPIKAVYSELANHMSGDKSWSGRNYGLGYYRSREIINVSQKQPLAPYFLKPISRSASTPMRKFHIKRRLKFSP